MKKNLFLSLNKIIEKKMEFPNILGMKKHLKIIFSIKIPTLKIKLIF